jgi:hypothetical protein
MTTNHNGDGLFQKNTYWLLNEVLVQERVTMERLLEVLRKMKWTGDVCAHIGEGGVRRIELHERLSVSKKDSSKIREILDIIEKTC